MPYIDQVTRKILNRGAVPQASGQLNYAFTLMIIEYIEEQELSYQTINDVIGALEQAKDEFRRRVVHPYENQKIAEHGDVYPAGLVD